MLKQLDASLWVNEVDFNLIGINFGNRMTCIQLEDGSLCLHSPTKFDNSTLEKLINIGEIKTLICPSLMHNLFIMKWKKKNPNATLFSPSKAKNVSPDVTFDNSSTKDINQLFNNELICIPIEGMPMLQEYAFIHKASNTLILTDLAFNFGNEMTGWPRFFVRLYGAHNKFSPTITIRALIKDKRAFGKSLANILSYNFDRIIVSHGHVIEKDGKKVMLEAFDKYLRNLEITMT